MLYVDFSKKSKIDPLPAFEPNPKYVQNRALCLTRKTGELEGTRPDERPGHDLAGLADQLELEAHVGLGGRPALCVYALAEVVHTIAHQRIVQQHAFSR